MFRQLGIVIILFSCLTGCLPKEINSTSNKVFFDKKLVNYIEQSACLNSPGKKSKIYYQIQDSKAKILLSSMDISTEEDLFDFDFKQPLKVSESLLVSEFSKLEREGMTFQKIFRLSILADRFEFLKCQQAELSLRKERDLRAYLNIKDQCQKNGNSNCDEEVIKGFFDISPLNLKDSVERMCQSFFDEFHCAAEKQIVSDKKQLARLTMQYLEWTQKEKFEPMFKIKKNNFFYCNQNSRVELPIKFNIISPLSVPGLKEDLGLAVKEMWKSDKFEIKVEENARNIVNVVLINSGVSHVINQDLRTIYLDQRLDRFQMGKVFAHEFGHVLGFPDCYIEFFDNLTSEIIYFELKDKKSNIMCSIKNNSKVPEDYFSQIIENSCKF